MIAPTIAHLLFLFLIVVAVAIATRYARVPYTVGLVIAGLLIGLLPRRAEFSLTPDLVMFVFLPALLFAGCWTLPLSVLRRNWLPVTLFATAGVFIGMLVARLVLVWGAHFSPSAAWLFGAIIAATDPVAVIAIFRSLRGNEELATILEGESLFNDATAVVAFKITLLVSLSAAPTVWFAPVADFVVLCAGGILVGAVIGVLALLFLRLIDDYLVEATTTMVVAYGAYLIADSLHVSGIFAVIVAGLLLSRVGERFGSFSATRQSVNQFWELVAFLSNSMLFLLVGLTIDLGVLYHSLLAVAWGVVAVAFSRVVSVYGLSFVSAKLGRAIPKSWQHIFLLGGLRGALSMALALSLPLRLPHRDLLIAMVFGVVLFTIVIQGLAIRPALVKLGLRAAA